MKAQLTTESKPYQLSLYLPTVLNKIYSDMDEYKVTVTHNPGQLLQIDTNGKKFKGFKISRTGSGNEREIVINGKKLGSGDYTLTDNSFSTKVTIADGNWIQPKITWRGKLPKTQAEAETDVNLKYVMADRDLIGKFSKVMNGKEYSVDFPVGSGVIPKIVWGQ